MTGTVDADPYPWPYDGTIDPARTALVNIDWQVDFCGQGGYVDAMGYDLNLTRVRARADDQGARRRPRRWGGRSSTPARVTARTSRTARRTSCGARSASAPASATPGPCGRILVRGEPGWEIVPEVAPIEGELIIDKPGKGSFYATDLDLLLRTARHHPPRLHRHHHRRVRAHDDARRQRPRLRVPAPHRLHRRDRRRQLRGRAEDGHDAGRRVRRRRPVRRRCWTRIGA